MKRALIGTTALVAVALVGTVLVVPATPVFAAGGNGGEGGNAVPNSAGGGGANGVKSPGANGSAPASLGYGSGGGGGGAGFSYTGSYGGGHGGNGSNDRGESGGYGAGGAGGIFTLGGNYGGGHGAYGRAGSYGGGGGGGGGGEHGFVGSHLPGSYVKGGYGGHGGKGSSHIAFVSGGGGGGGGGGFGAVVTSYSGQLSGTGAAIQGGNGGYGGAGGGTTPGTGNGGGGGEGGLGLLLFGTSQVTLGGTSTITGGNGGNGGNGGSWPTAIVGGNGGDGGVGGMGLQQFGAFQVTIGASSTVTGGNGGTGGAGGGASGLGGYYSFPGKSGAGGIGASINGGTLINSGTIKGGRGGYAPGGCSYFGCHQGPGGSGGSGVSIDGGALINTGGTIVGGNGGNSSAGFGGDGGSGVSSTGGGSVVNSGKIRGGSAYGFTTGSGGTGVLVTSGTLVNSGTIYGGNGGGYTHAKGGVGVYFNGGSLTNSGTIKGGYSNTNSGTQNNAITFGGGTNTLELWSSSVINGNVAATTGGNDTLALGGPTNGTFNVNVIGAQYQGFEAFKKTGNSTWTLTCTSTTTCPTAATPWTIEQGTLSISQDANLGATSGGLTFNGGALENTSVFTTTRSITLSSGGGTFNTAVDLTASGTISGPGALTKTGAGTLILTGDNSYVGGTTISAGTLAVSSDGNLGVTTGGLAFINGGTLQNTAAFTTARNISLLGPGTLQTDHDLTVSGFITDLIPFVGGALIKTGNGTLTLIGTNSYTGGTTISAGSLEVGNGGTAGSIVGDVLNSGSLAFNRADDVVYGGAISGNGVFTKAGAGTLTLGGDSTYTGDTTVAAGALLVNGSLGQTAVSVASGATLSGSGSIGGPVTVQSGGTLAGASGTTLGMGALTLTPGTITNILVNGPSFTLFDVASDLTVAGTLNVSTTGGYGRGVYHVVEYNGTFANNGLAIGSSPPGFISEINTESPNQLNLKVYDDPTATQFWRGDANPIGGNGTWSATNPNWRNADSRATTFWGGIQGIFHGTPGIVTVEGTQAFQSLEFVVSGYTLVSGNGGALAPTGTTQLWAEGRRTTATIATPIVGPGGIEKIGAGTIVLAAANSYSGGTTVTSGTLSISVDANLGAASGGLSFNGGTLENTAALATARAIALNGTATFKTAADLTITGVISGAGALTKADVGRLILTGNNTYAGGTVVHAGTLSASADANLGAASGGLTFHGGTLHNTAAFATGRAVTLHGGATFDTGADLTLTGVVAGGGTLIKSGEHRLTLTSDNIYAGGTAINAGTLRVGDGGTSGSIQGNVANNGLLAFDRSDTLTYSGSVSGSGGLAKYGAGTLILAGNSVYTGGTTINAGTLQIGDGGMGGAIVGDITNNGTLAIDSAANLALTGIIAGSGALTKSGSGTLMLAGNNSYAGGTSVNQGTLAISSDSNLGAPSGGLTLDSGELLPTASFATARAITLGPGGGAFFTPGGVTLSASGLLSGSGALTLAGGGTLSLGGSNTYTGATTVKAGGLIVNGSIASSSLLSVDPAGSVGGTGTLPSTAINGGMLAPGNSIGTLTVQGNFTQNGGAYQVELSPSVADRVNVTGSATINGGTVQLLAQSGSYANNTTYTIVNATGRVSGGYANVTEDFAFLTPTLSYDTNNVFLTLALLQGAFSFAGNTPNEKAVGYALDASFADATGDFATVISALAGLSTAQGPLALNTISGQPWANFGTMNVATGALFMNTLGQQMALARGGAAGSQRVALAEACDVAACEGSGPWSAWLSAVGGLGSVQGNRNASTFTYNAGGAAAGLDYRFDPRLLVGLSVGYTHGTQWTNGFMGQGWSDTVSAAVYGSFTQGSFYVDALAGFAWSTNQLQRQIVIPNLQPRTANGSAGASQFLGQAEAGYRIGIYAPAEATLTPFARLGVQSVTQYALSESGANSLSLHVAQQGTNSLRSTIGAELAGELPLSKESKLALALRLGWLHEFDDTSRPISAAFAGAPGNGFTVYGATPARDSAVLGFQASTAVADATSIYLRYDGEVGSGTDNHAINLGLRVSW